MPRYLDTTGRTKLAIAICARCSRKFPYDELQQDPNFPGLYVCSDDLDVLDPWRLPARPSDDITLDHPRPDVQLGPAITRVPVYQWTNQFYGVTQLAPVVPWAPNTFFSLGSTITPVLINGSNVPLPQPWLVCVLAGTSGPVAPQWPSEAGQMIGAVEYLAADKPTVYDFIQDSLTYLGLLTDAGVPISADISGQDGSVSWLCLGPYLV